MDDTVWNLEGHDEREPLHFTACGLDNVLLGSGYDVVDTPEGRGVRIRNLDELHCAIGEFLAVHKKTLIGKELRYLRQHMNLTQAELGHLIGLSSQQVARWEKGQCEISGAAESLLRVLFMEHLRKDISVRGLLLELGERDGSTEDKTLFVSTERGWQPIAL
jgi:DNA-binding transcriptional regulator YiaG